MERVKGIEPSLEFLSRILKTSTFTIGGFQLMSLSDGVFQIVEVDFHHLPARG